MVSVPTSAKGLAASGEGLSPQDLIRARHGLSLVLALLSLVALADMELAFSFLFGLAFLVVVVSLLVPMRVSRLPPVTFKILTPLLFAFALVDFVTSGRDILPPLLRLLFLLVIFRTLAPRRNREEFQLLLISLFLLVIAGVFTLSLQFAVQLVVFAPLAICLLMLMNLIEAQGAQGGYPEWEGFRWRDFLARVRASCNRWTVGLTSFIFFGFFAVSALIFVLIPRVNLDHSVPFFQLPGSTASGFSDTMSLGDVTNITLDDSVAFRVDPSSMRSIPSLPYWRMLVLDRYRPGRFEISDATERGFGRFSRQSQVVSVSDPQEIEGHLGESLTFYFEGGISKYLPMPGAVEELRFQNRQELFLLPALSVRHLRNTLSSVFFFQIRGFAFSSEFPASEHDEGLTEMETLWLTGPEAIFDSVQMEYPRTTLAITLSETEDREYLEHLVQELAKDLSPEHGPREFAAVVASHLSRNHGYSLSPEVQIGFGDPVLDWLRSGGPGHCEYFAAAFSLILRAAGIPSRVVVGFMGGSVNPYENYFVVRNRHAHAWVEYFDGSAWVRADPTPGNEEAASVGEDGLVGFAEDPRGFGNWVDSLRVIWYRRVVNFDEQDQSELVAGFRATWDNWRQDTKASIQASADWVKSVFLEWRNREWGSFFMIIFLLVAASLACAAFKYRHYLWFVLQGGGKSGVVVGANRRLAGGLLGKIESFKLESEKCDVVTADLRRIRYGPKETWPHPPETFRIARKHLRALRRRFRNGEVSPQAHKLNPEKSGEPLMDTDEHC